MTGREGQMAYWKCAACGYEAQNDKQKQEHTTKMANDPIHAKNSRPAEGQRWGGESAPVSGGGTRGTWKRPEQQPQKKPPQPPAKAPNQPPPLGSNWGRGGKGDKKPPTQPGANRSSTRVSASRGPISAD